MTDLKRVRATAEQRKKERCEFYCYDECIKRGCKESFLDTFRKRMFISSVSQTKAFIEELNNPECCDPNGTRKRFEQWKIFLSVLIEKRPDHKKYDEWVTSLNLISKANIPN